ncbi:MAG: 30S ribosome-binding factor RbfA [Arenicella sp.]
MPNSREFPRSDRVAQAVSRGLANLLQFEVKDQRVKRLSVVEVNVTRDLRHATIFVFGSQMVDDNDIETSMRLLDKAKPFLKRRLAQTMDMRRCPDLHFKYDHSIVRGQELSALIDSVVEPEASDLDENEK